jgi:hypothetical protein
VLQTWVVAQLGLYFVSVLGFLNLFVLEQDWEMAEEEPLDLVTQAEH